MSETPPATCTRKPWALTFFCLLAIAGLIAMPFLAGPPDGAKMPDFVRFIGHFHPVLLHLPIGVFSLILFQELGAIFGSRTSERKATPMFPMFFGAASAIVAVIAGFLLFHGHAEDYGSNAIAERHLWGGLIFAVAAVFTFIVKSWTVSNPAFYRLLLFSSVGIMAFASHDGATLTHGEGYLTKYAPEPLRRAMGIEEKKAPKEKDALAAPAGSQLVYADIVAPILERRCVQCHKESKAKGKLRMDTFEMLVKGGSDGPAIEAGSAAKSHIIERIELPKDDEDHMPPEGKPAIEAHEIAVLKWWIDSGADAKKAVNEIEIPTPINEAIAKLAAAGSTQAAQPAVKEAPKPTGPDAALQSAVSGISKEFPGALTFESQQSSALTFTAVSLRGNFDDAGFKKLEKLLPHLVTLDLSATKVTDHSIALLASASQLRMIRLAETSITDASIESLLKLPSLESINLYGTKVTDAGVSKLSALPNLKRLYLWQTAVTPEAVKALKAKLPSCEIITGATA